LCGEWRRLTVRVIDFRLSSKEDFTVTATYEAPRLTRLVMTITLYARRIQRYPYTLLRSHLYAHNDDDDEDLQCAIYIHRVTRKTGPFLNVDNFAMVSGRKACEKFAHVV